MPLNQHVELQQDKLGLAEKQNIKCFLSGRPKHNVLRWKQNTLKQYMLSDTRMAMCQ